MIHLNFHCNMWKKEVCIREVMFCLSEEKWSKPKSIQALSMLSGAKWQVGLDLLPSLLFLFCGSFCGLGGIVPDFSLVWWLKNQGTCNKHQDTWTVHQFLHLSSCFSHPAKALRWIAEDIGETVVLCDSVLRLLQIHVWKLWWLPMLVHIAILLLTLSTENGYFTPR